MESSTCNRLNYFLGNCCICNNINNDNFKPGQYTVYDVDLLLSDHAQLLKYACYIINV